MSFKQQGDFTLKLQEGASITENDDGTKTGIAVFIGDQGQAAFAPRIGSGHPFGGGLECTSYTIESIALGRIRYTANYFGVTNDTRRVSYTAGVASEDIQLHPKFSKIAGTPESPKNGAKWVQRTDPDAEEDYYEFLGFFNGKEGPTEGDNSLVGVTNYLQPSGTVEVSYYTSRTPRAKRLGTSHNSIKGYNKPDGVKNFLLTDMPYRQIGKSFYQVTETYLASDEKGWNRYVYDNA